MEPARDSVSVDVEGFFKQKITIKSGEIKTPPFKVYNAVQAFFTKSSDMLDFKASDGKIYHLDKREIESFLGEPVSNRDPIFLEKVIDQVKNDHLVIRNIKDLRRITSEKGREFKTLSDRVIRLYDNFSTYNNKERVNVHNAKKSYLYTGKSLDYSISDNWQLFKNQCKDQTILVNNEDLQSWFHHEVFLVLEKKVGKEILMEWARESGKFHYYDMYHLSMAFFSNVFYSNTNVVSLDNILKNVDSVLKFKEAKDLKQEEERKKKEQEAAHDLEKVNKANAEYQQVLQKISGPQVTPQASKPEVQSYRSYDLRNGKQDYELSQEEAKAKRERELENLKYNQAKAEVQENKAENLSKNASPKRHEEGSVSSSDKSRPLDSDKSKGPKRH